MLDRAGRLKKRYYSISDHCDLLYEQEKAGLVTYQQVIKARKIAVVAYMAWAKAVGAWTGKSLR